MKRPKKKYRFPTLIKLMESVKVNVKSIRLMFEMIKMMQEDINEIKKNIETTPTPSK